MGDDAGEQPEGYDDGWDADARLVDGQWVERTPRRPDRAEPLRRETRLLPWLGPQLPVPVPRPVVVSEDPLVVRHEVIVGDPWNGQGTGIARTVGDAVRSLHRVSATDAKRLGIPELTPDWYDDLVGEVLPLVAEELRQRGRWLLERLATYPRSSLVHGDLVSEHLLVRDGHLAGIIDWSDCGVGDPALDLAWLLHETPPTTADTVARAYGVRRGLRARILDWHALAPWHGVLRGLREEDEAMRREALVAVDARLRLVPDQPPAPSRRVPPLGIEPRLNRF